MWTVQNKSLQNQRHNYSAYTNINDVDIYWKIPQQRCSWKWL